MEGLHQHHGLSSRAEVVFYNSGLVILQVAITKSCTNICQTTSNKLLQKVGTVDIRDEKLPEGYCSGRTVGKAFIINESH